MYASVVATKLFVVGAANPRTGIHFQHPSADTVWQHTGPVNIRAFGVAVGPGPDQKVLYIASGNGVHKSTDGGATWKITTGWNITEVLERESRSLRSGPRLHCHTLRGLPDDRRLPDVAGMQPRSRGHVHFAGDGESAGHTDRSFAPPKSGAYVSTDGATTWKRMGLSVGGSVRWCSIRATPTVFAAGTEDHGLYMSTDGGKVWTRREAGIDHLTFYAVAFDPSAPDTMYAGGYVTGVYRSIGPRCELETDE